MPRPRKCRRVCSLPQTAGFVPCGRCSSSPVILQVDEYEAIRLLDLEALTQEECAKQMEIARTTVTAIYASARQKIADALVNAKPLRIEGGDVVACEYGSSDCSSNGCRNHHKPCCRRFRDKCSSSSTCQMPDENTTDSPDHSTEREHCFMTEGDSIMKIAVTYENGEVFQHFGHTEQFKLFEIQNGAIVGSEIVPTLGSGHGALAGFLKDHQVEALICGGIGGGAKTALAEAGIKLYGGITGSADNAVKALLENKLSYTTEANCDHHDHEHQGTCGEHGCGNH